LGGGGGRGAQRAYAYFFRHKRRPTTVEGLERLEVIAENTQLGAGYSIAMRDLEMRGAGEMLGTRQHGVIASVGFHLYTRMLAQAVRQLRQAGGIKPAEDEPEVRGLGLPVSVDLPLGIGIPSTYIPDQNLRLKLYRRLAGMEDAQELEQLHEEFVDRFGVLPEAVQSLFYQMRVKLYAQKVGLASVAMEGEQVVLRFPPLPDGMTERKLPAVAGARTGRNAYWMAGGADWQERLLRLLSDLEELCQPYC